MNQPMVVGLEYGALFSLIVMTVACYQVIWVLRIGRSKDRTLTYKMIGSASLIYTFSVATIHELNPHRVNSYFIFHWNLPVIIAVSAALAYGSLWMITRMNHSVRRQLGATILLAGVFIVQQYVYNYMRSDGSPFVPPPDSAAAAGSVALSALGAFTLIASFELKKEWLKWLYAAAAAFLTVMAQWAINPSVNPGQPGRLPVPPPHELTATIFFLSMLVILIGAINLVNWMSGRKFNRLKGHYKHFIEHSTDGFALINEGKWIYMNPACLKMLGCRDEEDIIGRSVYEFLADRYAGEVRRRIEFIGEYPVQLSKPLEIEWQAPQGNSLYTETIFTSSSVRDQTVYRAIIRDISDRKENERRFIHTEKLYVAGQLAAGIAHEIRNPLTTLKGFLQLLSESQSHQYYDIMKSELRRIEMVISELLMVSKPQAEELARSDMVSLMKETIKLLEAEAILRDIVFELQASKQPLWVFGVESQMKQVFVNVINNAIEAMKNGGIIRIGMELQNDTVEIRMKDEGVGMTQEQLAKLGQPFYTTKERGTGLGLMVTYKIVDNHQGSIEASSSPGEGTQFIIRLPYFKEE